MIKLHHEVKKIKKIVDGKEEEVEKKWSYFELSEYSYSSFTEVEQKALQVGAGLRKLGLVEGDKLHMFAATQ
jgi:long-chain acyl-CoA synthetase